MWLAVVAALGSALLLAVASVLQHRAGQHAPSPTLLATLCRPIWLAGAIVGVCGFALHAVALAVGNLSVVQPLLVTGLLFALPLGCALERRSASRSELLAAAAVVGGLALFQLSAHTAVGTATASSRQMSWCVVAVAVISGCSVVAARRRRRLRATLLGLCTGCAYGLTAALMKTSLGAYARDGLAVLSTWEIYAFVVVVVMAIAVNQLAFNAGPLSHSLPLITIVDPIVAVVIGSVAFGETLAGGTPALLARALAVVLIILGVVVLARTTATDVVPSRTERVPPHEEVATFI